MDWKTKKLSKVLLLCQTCSVGWKKNLTVSEVFPIYIIFVFLNSTILFYIDNRDEDDYDEDEEDGSEGEFTDDEQADPEDDENRIVGLTPQQQELLQIVSFEIFESVPGKQYAWTSI